jgi:hypothetical protein
MNGFYYGLIFYWNKGDQYGQTKRNTRGTQAAFSPRQVYENQNHSEQKEISEKAGKTTKTSSRFFYIYSLLPIYYYNTK